MSANESLPNKTKARNFGLYSLAALFVAPPALGALVMLLFWTWIVVSGGFTYFANHISGKPLQLQRAVFLASPNGKTEFVAERDGTMQLVDIGSGRILQSHQYSPEDYMSVDAKWDDNDRLELSLPFRQPLLANGLSVTCDVHSGFPTSK